MENYNEKPGIDKGAFKALGIAIVGMLAILFIFYLAYLLFCHYILPLI